MNARNATGDAAPRLSVTEMILAIGAGLWGLMLVPVFCIAPLYSVVTSSAQPGSGNGAVTTLETVTSATLVEVNGQWALSYAIAPLLIAALVVAVLWERPVARGAGPISWTAAGLLVAFTMLAMMSIGLFLLPLAGATMALCVVRQSRAGRLVRSSREPGRREPGRRE